MRELAGTVCVTAVSRAGCVENDREHLGARSEVASERLSP